jgi:hypothetical protein
LRLARGRARGIELGAKRARPCGRLRRGVRGMAGGCFAMAFHGWRAGSAWSVRGDGGAAAIRWWRRVLREAWRLIRGRARRWIRGWRQVPRRLLRGRARAGPARGRGGR